MTNRKKILDMNFSSEEIENTEGLINMLAYHECSHAILAHLFFQYLEIDGVTLSKTEAAKHNSLDGADAAITVKAKGFHFSANDARAITFLAGFIGQNIHLKGREVILAEKKSIQHSPNSFNIELCGGDLKLFYMDAPTNAKAHGLQRIDYYQQFCLGFLIDFLCDEKVWSFVEILVNELKSQDNLTLSKEQLETIFKKIGLDEYLNERRLDLLKILETPSFENDQHAQSTDGSKSIIWTGDLNDDCTARWNGLILRAELMVDDIWWWAISKDNDNPLDEIDSTKNYDTICIGGEQARQSAEAAARKFIDTCFKQ